MNVSPAVEAQAVPQQGVRGTFRALRHRGYRYMWVGQLGNSTSLWMEQVVRPLLILQLTGSAFQVGLIIAARMAPIFAFGLIAGVAADRYDRRKILVMSQAVTMLMHLTLGLLLLFGVIQVWHIFATAVISGASNAFIQPARQSMVPRLVPKEDLLNALALNSAAMNLMRVFGASLAGLLLVFFDYSHVYLVNAAIYLFIIWTTTQLPKLGGRAESGDARGRHGSMSKDFLEGFKYVNANRRVLYLIGLAMLIFIFGQPYQQVFIPLIGLKVLEIGKSGTGLLLAVSGVGALTGALFMASRGAMSGRGFKLLCLLGVFSLAMLVLAQSSWVILSAAALLVAGCMTTSYMAIHNTLLLEQTPVEFHGRVMSLMSLDRGLMSIGAVMGGALAQFLGPQWGLTVVALLFLGFTLAVGFGIPVLRRMQ